MDRVGEVFRLQAVTVQFRLGAIHERSLKEALARLLRRVSPPVHRVLRGVDLSVRAGVHVGVVGRNGAGKSTLLRVLARVITPQAGTVHVERELRVAPLLELGIGFQPDLSGIENCHLAGALMGLNVEEKHRYHEKCSVARSQNSRNKKIPIPTNAKSGSFEKIEILRQRVSNGEELWHPEDSIFKIDEDFI